MRHPAGNNTQAVQPVVRPPQYDQTPANGDLEQPPEQPVDLDLLILELMQNVRGDTENIPANFGVSTTFHC